MRKIKGVLFDKDGTLINFEQTWVPTYQAAALTLSNGNPKLAKDILHGSGLHKDNTTFIAGSTLAAGTNNEIAKLWSRFLPHYTQADLKKEIDSLLEEGAVTNAVEIADTENFFLYLSSLGLKLGVATNDSENSAVQTMTSLLGTAKVDFVAGFDSGYGGKPGPGMFTAFCKTVKINPQEVAVVGDNPQDLEMGRRGGAGQLIGVLSGNSSLIELEAYADNIIDDINSLESILNGFQK